MKVLHIAGSVASAGAEKYILTIAENIGREFEITVACPCYGRLVDELRDRGVKTIVLGKKVKYKLSACLGLAAFMRKNKVQIVHSHNPRSDFCARISSRLAGVPIHISTVHNSIYAVSILKTWAYLFFYSLPLYMPDKLIALSQAGSDELVYRCKVDPQRVVAIPIGVDTERFDPTKYDSGLRDALGIEPNIPLIGIVAQLTAQKGHIYLLEAMRRIVRAFPKTKCLIVGDGPLREKLQGLAEKLGLSGHCIFTGARDDIPEVLSALDVWVLPSVASEGLPRALLEALAMGKPVVTTRVGGIPELVIDGITGILVPPKDSEALKDAILSLLMDREKAREMGKRSRELVVKNFTQELMVRRIEKLYRTLMEEKRCLKSRQLYPLRSALR